MRVILLRFSLIFLFVLSLAKINVICFAFEDELSGSTGWSSINLPLRISADDTSNIVTTVVAGQSFLILSEYGNYWEIEYLGMRGYVNNNYCMINLPDVIPSIVYNISNADSSIYKSSGYNLPDVTGKQLYSSGKVMNHKIGREEYICPVLYSTAKMIDIAQQMALNDGYSLMIYDSYRPRSVSSLISQKLNVLYNGNNIVKNNIDYSVGKSGTKYFWGQSWFLAQTLSSHNTGSAIDVTLFDFKTNSELQMPTSMHELSTQAIKYYNGSVSKTYENYSVGMLENIYAQRLDNYMISAGMNTLASEWWHFQDQDGYERIKNMTSGNGCDFQVTGILSQSNKTDSDGITYTVTYKDGNNIFMEDYEKGESIVFKTDLEKVGYKLVGWIYNGDEYKLYDNLIMPDCDIELIAKWELVIPEITKYETYKDIIIGISLNTEVNKINLGIDSIYDVKVYDYSNELKTSGLIGTGDKVKIYLSSDLMSEYNVIIKGDITGDGNSKVNDVAKLYQYLKGKIIMDECYIRAGNVVDSDDLIKINDVAKLYQFIKGKIDIL